MDRETLNDITKLIIVISIASVVWLWTHETLHRIPFLLSGEWDCEITFDCGDIDAIACCKAVKTKYTTDPLPDWYRDFYISAQNLIDNIYFDALLAIAVTIIIAKVAGVF